MDKARCLICKSLIFLLFLLILNSCSINYEEVRKSANQNKPELSFQDVIFNRYENNRIIVSLDAEKLEQYKSNVSYARKVSFDFWNNNEEKELCGSCRLVGIQPYKNIFTLYDDIYIQDIKTDSEIKASTLQWNSEKKTLISDKSKTVNITKKNITIEGQCFSADGKTNSYEYSSGVSGTINIDSSED